MKLRCIVCACCLAAVVLPHSVAAQNYTFTNIADTTGLYSSFVAGGLGGPRLNNSGAVSFVAQLDAGGGGVYRSDGVFTTPIADPSGPLQNFRYSDINDAGQVAYSAEKIHIGPGIFRGDGLSTTTIVWESELPVYSDPFLFGPITINNPGTVAFLASGYPGFIEASMFVGSGGNITYISDTTDYRAGNGQINNLGIVAFVYQLFGAAGSGIGLGNGGTTSIVIDDTGPYSVFATPGLNGSNVVAVAAKHDAGGWYALRIDGATVDVVAGPFQEGPDPVYGTISGVLDVGLNNAGDVAFLAQLEPSAFGILTGPDPVADKVIRDGDALFGSTATILHKGLLANIDGPNDAGQIVFRYSLADGRSGIALATPVVEMLCPGDYNGNTIVDAADYTVWRDAMTAGASSLPNDPTPGTVDESDFLYWRDHFGESPGSGSGVAAAVPEPSTLSILLMATLAILSRQRSAVP